MLNHSKFWVFLLEIDVQYVDVIYHTDVHWHGHGTVLEKFQKKVSILLN